VSQEWDDSRFLRSPDRRKRFDTPRFSSRMRPRPTTSLGRAGGVVPNSRHRDNISTALKGAINVNMTTMEALRSVTIHKHRYFPRDVETTVAVRDLRFKIPLNVTAGTPIPAITSPPNVPMKTSQDSLGSSESPLTGEIVFAKELVSMSNNLMPRRFPSLVPNSPRMWIWFPQGPGPRWTRSFGPSKNTPSCST
jgi:hypothetical protein